ncbi:MAG: hypothetical protein HYR85_18480 [Planctomycetes bacterium]|nr:hypothetical protein [Planctomycetota bacterium]
MRDSRRIPRSARARRGRARAGTRRAERCAGCACGEEPYTLAIFWREHVLPTRSDLPLTILATDVREDALERARRGVYAESSLRWVPDATRARWFERVPEGWRVADALRERIEFRHHDLFVDAPPCDVAIVLCRNVVFTYFGDALRSEAVARVHSALRPGGLLAIGDREHWDVASAIAAGFDPVPGDPGVFRRRE